MIEIKNLQKWYKSKSGKKHQALKNINLEIGNKGFVVLLGKSGSGKSTLLNILGGLDKFDSGEIGINGNSTINFKNNQWDSYRNSYIGFIFQNFNIMENISVYDNVALPLELQGYNREDINRLVDGVLERVALKEYKDRKPNELSGGQKQRVAIARALVKDPEIILADEPTGNLDSKTGKSILEILKKLSKDKLIIMVTHNSTFAHEYGDRIIELKDGEVISDIINQNDDNNYLENKDIDIEFNFKKLSLNFKNAFKLALSSIFTKKIRLFFMMILFTIALILVGMGTNFSNYDSNQVAINTFKNADMNQILIEKLELVKFENDDDSYYHISSENGAVTKEDYDYFKQNYQSIEFSEVINGFHVDIDKWKNYDYPILNPYFKSFDAVSSYTRMIILENEESVTKHGYEIIAGKNISQKDEILITDYIAECLLFYKTYGDISIDELIGKEISVNHYKFKIAGVVKTDLEKYQELKDIGVWDWDYDNQDKFNFDLAEKFLMLLTTKANYELMESNSFYRFSLTEIRRYELTENDDNDIVKIDGYYRSNLYIVESLRYSQDNELLMGDSRLPENDYEVVISLSTLIGVLNNENDENDTDLTYEDVINNSDDFLSEAIGMQLKLFGVTPMVPIKIVGVYDDMKYKGEPAIVIVKDDYYKDRPFMYMERIKRSLLVSFGNNNKENIEFLKYLDEYQYPDVNIVVADDFEADKKINIYYHNTEYSGLIYYIEDLTESSRNDLYFLSGIISLFTSVMIFTFISSSINTKKKEIGILRALGARGKDVAKIFVVEGLMITLTAVILARILMSLIIRLINDQIASWFSTDLVLLYDDFLSVLVIVGGGLLVTLLSSLVPIKRITLMKPIDAIKNK